MFKRKAESAPARLESFIGAGCAVEGTLKCDGALRVDGRIEGRVIAQGEIWVGEQGEVHADVQAQTAIVAGTIIGDVAVVGRLELRASARLDGNVKAQALIIESGAQFRGRSEVVHIERGDGVRAELSLEPVGESV